jgi:hypothetical protein
MRALVSCLLLAAPLTSACTSTHYEPARSPHLVKVSEGYIRDGLKYPEGFGGGLVEAVHGCARAEAEARSARTHNIVGLVLSGAGLTLEGTGIVLALAGAGHDKSTQESTLSTSGKVGVAVALTGVVTTIVGGIVAADGPPKAMDAINMCNDEIDAKARARR